MYAPKRGSRLERIYMKTNNNLTVIIRACGERTVSVCRRLVEEQVAEEQVFVISEAPFARALRRTYEIGIERHLPWTLAVDADVLIRDGAVAALLIIAQELPEHVFAVQGQILDKLSGGPRHGGLKLCRTAMLPHALSCIPPERSAKRPESHTLGQMGILGFPTLEIDPVLGLHDYEQWHRDTYRKAFFHAHKFADAVHAYWGPMWARLARHDNDYQVALLGMKEGLCCDGKVISDVTQFSPEAVTHLLQENGLSEKSEFTPGEATGRQIQEMINAHIPAREYWSWRLLRHPDAGTGDGIGGRLRRTVARTGWLGLAPYAVGGVMTSLGRRLQSLAKRA